MDYNFYVCIIYNIFNNKFSMLKVIIFFPLFLMSVTSLSQESNDFMMKNDKFMFNKLTDIIIKSKKFNYYILKKDDGEIIHDNSNGHFIILTKDIEYDDIKINTNFFKGMIMKKLYFVNKNIVEATIWKIETETVIYCWNNLVLGKIKKYFTNAKTEMNTNLSSSTYEELNFNSLINFKSFTNNTYDVIDSRHINIPCYYTDNMKDCSIKLIHSIGDSYEIKNDYTTCYLFSSISDYGMEKLLNNIDIISNKYNESYEKLKYNIDDKDIREINVYDLKKFVNTFLADCKNNGIKIEKINEIEAKFEPLESNTIALAYEKNNNEKVRIIVDPIKWKNSNIEKKWYIIYHELGHDILNLEHGDCGKMMFNFADRDYTWNDFFTDKEYMFNCYKEKK